METTGGSLRSSAVLLGILRAFEEGVHALSLDFGNGTAFTVRLDILLVEACHQA